MDEDNDTDDDDDDDELRPSTSSCCARSIVPSSNHYTYELSIVQKYEERKNPWGGAQSPVSSSSVFPEAEQWRLKKQQQRQIMQTNFEIRVRRVNEIM